jgi:hypothetical protein
VIVKPRGSAAGNEGEQPLIAEHWYRAYGLLIRSAIGLPEFLPVGAVDHDLAIRASAEAAREWRASGAGEAADYGFVPAPRGGFVMHVPGIADYWVREGREIAFTPAAGSDAAAVRLYLLGSALGMALHQRGLPVLHGATVLQRQGATIFVGDSGQGKSTLAARLGRDGYPILGDDTMPLWPQPCGGFAVWPGSRLFKLWSDSLAVLGETAARLESVGNRMHKYFVPNTFQPADRPVPVAEVVELAAGRGDAAPGLEMLDGLEALRVIVANTYRPEYVALLGREAEHFRLCARLAGGVAVRRLRRPWDIGRLGESLALLRRCWAGASRAAGGAP